MWTGNIYMCFRHDCGEGAIEDVYRGPFALKEWHSVMVWRKFCDRTQLKVDSRPLMVDLTEQFRVSVAGW